MSHVKSVLAALLVMIPSWAIWGAQTRRLVYPSQNHGLRLGKLAATSERKQLQRGLRFEFLFWTREG